MTDWKEFEVLVAALHHSSSNGGTVTWSEKIFGRQFDVTIRFSHGVHDYLTVVECRDYKKPVPVSDVEAFVTKAKGVKANKAVVVSASGFQSGAVEVAKRENVVLLNVTECYDDPPLPADAEKVLALNIKDIVINFKDGSQVEFPDGSKLQYLVGHTYILDSAGIRTTVDELLSAWVQVHLRDQDAARQFTIPIPPNSAFEDQEGTAHPGVSALSFSAVYIDAHVSKSTPPLDFQLQQALAKKYVLARPDGTPVFDSFFTDLSLGLWTKVEPGKYYYSPALGFYYRCEDITDNLVTWFMVESFQHGTLVQGRFTAKTKYNEQYVPVSDKAKLAELNRRYQKIRKKELREIRRIRNK